MRRSTAILLALFFLLGVFVWYTQQPDNLIKAAFVTATAIPPVTKTILVDPNDGPVVSISITDNNGKTMILDKTSGQWIVKIEKEIPADQTQAESAAGQALNLRIIKEFEISPGFGGTGLAKPVYTIALGLANKSSVNFAIGTPTITNSGYYASTTDGKVYILGKDEVDALTQYFTAPPLHSTIPPGIMETETPKP